MRTVLTFFGAVALVGLFALFGLSFYIMSRIGPLTEEAKLFADNTIVAVTTDWEVQAMLDRASPEFLNAASEERLVAFTDFHREDLGVLDAYDNGAQCLIVEQHYSLSGTHFARTVCYALIRFMKADAKIRLPVIKRGETWAMQGFHLEEVAYHDEDDRLIARHLGGEGWPNVTLSWSDPATDGTAPAALLSPATGR